MNKFLELLYYKGVLLSLKENKLDIKSVKENDDIKILTYKVRNKCKPNYEGNASIFEINNKKCELIKNKVVFDDGNEVTREYIQKLDFDIEKESKYLTNPTFIYSKNNVLKKS